MTKSNNWAVFKDNEPKYKVGDLVLYNYPRLVGYIEKVEKETVTEEVKEEIKKHVARTRNCCNKEGQGMIRKNFHYKYKINGKLIPENEIIDVGIEKVNEHIKELNKMYDDLSEKVSNAASTLGYNDNW